MEDLELARYITALKFEDLPENIVHTVKRLILDAIGNALEGACEKKMKGYAEYIRKLGCTENSTVFGKGFKTDCAQAAFLNAAHSQIHDFNDGHAVSANSGGGKHPGRVVIPAALAMGEKMQVTGKELITSIAIGYDVCTKFRGGPPEIAADTYASAAIAGKLMGFDGAGVIEAMGIAGCMSPHQVPDSYTYVDYLYTAYKVKNGIEAALMVETGIPGFPLCYDRDRSLFTVEKGLGSVFEVANVYIKPYPTCRATHTSIEAALELMSEFGISHRDVDKMEIEMMSSSMYVAREAVGPDSTPKQCEFSVRYAVACAILDGRVGLEHFTPEAISNSVTHDLVKKINVTCVENIEGYEKVKGSAAIVTIRTQNGGVHSRRKVLAKGHPLLPMPDKELTEKFLHITHKTLTEERALRIRDVIFRLENVDNIIGLTELL